MTRVFVSGKTYFAALDATGTDFYRDHPEIPEPDGSRHGRGTRWDFGELSDGQLFTLLYRLEQIADNFLGGGVDDDTVADGRAVRKDWTRLMKAAEPRTVGYYMDYTGGGWYYNGRGWIYVRRTTSGGALVPAGSSDYPRPWLDVGRHGPFRLVSPTWPDETWRKVETQQNGVQS